MANYKFLEKTQDEDYTVIKLKIESDVFVKRKDKIFNKLTKDMKITGFRPGKAPKPMLEARLGADLYENTLNDLLPEVTYEYLSEEKIDFLGRLNYEVIKVSDAEGVEYKIKFIKYPEIKLPKFSKIKVQDEKIELTEEEIDEELAKIFKYKEGKDDSKNSEKTKKTITDEEVKSLGVGLNTVAEIKDLIRKQLEIQKQNLAKNKQAQEVIDQAIEMSNIKAPKSLLDGEVAKKEHDYSHRIEDLGLKLEDFLKSQKTTIEDLRKGWQDEAEKQIKTDLLLFEIAKVNELKVQNEEVNAEINSITDDKLKKQYDSYDGRNYISGIILQQKAINWLMQETGINPKPAQEKTENKKS
ncbi:MAG TPA: trigger factor [Candidatus Dojkabacteria bacterium]|nr:trigger factor [Candidatus Dojkabacteria bacterium]HRP51466.1 trigger factor [Candidatus Dojkabacteria bacterium]